MSWAPCKHSNSGCPWWSSAADGFCEPCRNRGCHQRERFGASCVVRESVVLQRGLEPRMVWLAGKLIQVTPPVTFLYDVSKR